MPSPVAPPCATTIVRSAVSMVTSLRIVRLASGGCFLCQRAFDRRAEENCQCFVFEESAELGEPHSLFAVIIEVCFHCTERAQFIDQQVIVPRKPRAFYPY